MQHALQALDDLRPADRAAGHRAHIAQPPLRVLHLFKYFRPDFTGDGIYLEKLIPHLERASVRNDVAAEFTRPGTAASSARLFGRFHFALFNPAMFLWFLLHVWRYDVIHFHTAVDRHFLYHLIARAAGRRVVQSCTLDDGIGSLVAGYRAGFRRVVRRLCGLIHDVVAISPALASDSVRVMPDARVHLIPQGVALPVRDPAARAAARARFGFAADDVVALFVGGLCARKDARFLVDSLPTDVARLHLLLVGPELERPYVAALRAAIAESPARDRIHLAGFMADPSDAYRAADMFVFASHKEGCPNVVLEAMAHGLPVVSRHLPDTTDALLDHGRTGLLFATAAEFQDAVRGLAADPARRREMGRSARDVVAAGYDMQVIADRYAALYRRAA
jgi:glycosyltransferase involved in cell wall biosynthesis